MMSNVDEISLCKNCHCMTKTINNKCGKCGDIKVMSNVDDKIALKGEQ